MPEPAARAAGLGTAGNPAAARAKGATVDIYCPKCGEPWDMDTLHEEAAEAYGVPYYVTEDDRRAMVRNPAYDPDAYAVHYQAVRAAFQTKGCGEALPFITTGTAFGKPCEREADASDGRLTNSAAAAALYDLLGDDLDGAAAMLEDFQLGY